MAITVSAPGKLLLFGEHAVVYGYPCIVSSVSDRLTVFIQESEKSGVEIKTPGVFGSEIYTICDQ